MTRQYRRAAVTVGLSLMLGSTVLLAQSSGLVKQTAEIPFAFQAGSQWMDAGTYTVAKSYSSGVLVMTNTQTGKSAMAMTHPGRSTDRPGEPILVFHGYAGTYFLSEVWFYDESFARSLPVSAHEKEMSAGPSRVPGVLAYVRLK